MSRNLTYTKNDVLKAAFYILKTKGIIHLKVRTIASAMHSSTSPIYRVFDSIKKIEDAMVTRIIEIFLEDIIHEEDYYLFPNMTFALCMFAKKDKKLFERVFLNSDFNGRNQIREKVFYRILKEILSKDPNFSYEKDYDKILLADGLALKFYNADRNISENEIREMVQKYVL